MASKYYDDSGKEVFTGDTVLAADSNTINSAINSGFELVEADFVTALVDVQFYTDLAQKWAENPEDVEVETGSYSSLNWAIKSSDSAAAALVSEGLADADATQTASDRVQTGLDLVATNQDTIDTAADVVTTNADVVLTGLDVDSTNADVITTNADVVLTNADVVLTGLDVDTTSADVVSTNADVVLTGLDATATAADRVQTGLDAIDTGNDAASTASLYDQFDDRYLGDKASDPTLDNDGNPLLTGALYFNTTTDVMKVYDGASWLLAYAELALEGTATGDINMDGYSLQETAYDQADDLSVGTGSATLNYALGDMREVTATGDFSFFFTNFPTGKVCSYILDIVDGGDWTITYPVGTLFSGLVEPTLTSGGTDRILIIKDKDEVFSFLLVGTNIGVVA